VELCLAVEADGALDRKGQRDIGCEGGRKAEPGSNGGFAAHAAQGVVSLAIGVVGDAAESAVDPFPGNRGCNVFDRGLVCLPVNAGRGFSVAAGQFRVGEAVQRGDFAGGVSGDSGADSCGLDHRNRLAGPFEGQSRCESGDAPADHGNVDVNVGVQGGVCGAAGRGYPEGKGLAPGLPIHGPLTHGPRSTGYLARSRV
jgi:hypothetical protein